MSRKLKKILDEAEQHTYEARGLLADAVQEIKKMKKKLEKDENSDSD